MCTHPMWIMHELLMAKAPDKIFDDCGLSSTVQIPSKHRPYSDVLRESEFIVVVLSSIAILRYVGYALIAQYLISGSTQLLDDRMGL